MKYLRGIVDDNDKLASFDITNMYLTNTHCQTKSNNKKILKTKYTKITTIDLLGMYDFYLSQSYCSYNSVFFQQIYGLTMGCPSPAILFLQYFEEGYIVQITINHHFLGYFGYVNDILIIYYRSITDMNLFLKDCDLIRPQLQLTLELECNNILNCLGLSISRKNMEMEFDIYRKCTYSDVTVLFNLFCPVEHKLAT